MHLNYGVFKKSFFLVYAIGGYILGQLCLLYLIGFFIDFGVPKGISSGYLGFPIMDAIFDFYLVLIFGFHHSITARKSFKSWWKKIIPPSIERATYLYMTTIMTAGLVYFWKPIPITIWEIQEVWSITALYTVYGLVWAMMMVATFQFGHFSFFGLAQAWSSFRKKSPQNSSITINLLYALVRHPISLGWMLTPLITPHLTVGHLVFAGAVFIYIYIVTPFEEADLIEELGDQYLEYRKRTPAFLPTIKSKKHQG